MRSRTSRARALRATATRQGPEPSAPLEPDEVAKTLTAFINASIMARGHPVRPDDDLEAAGVDSMGLLKILLFIEATFGFWMPDAHLVEENIRSAHALAAYICRRRHPS